MQNLITFWLVGTPSAPRLGLYLILVELALLPPEVEWTFGIVHDTKVLLPMRSP